METSQSSISLIQQNAHEILGDEDDFDTLLEAIGDSTFVLLGEASHGTREFYRTRALLTRRLIKEMGTEHFQRPNPVSSTKKPPGQFYRPRNHETPFFAVEADWPGAYRIRYLLFDIFYFYELL